MRLLHADDCSADAALLELLLRDLGVVVTIDRALDGRAVLDLLERHAYDLVLLDINMPVMNGLEVLATLGRERAKALPITVLTSSAQECQCGMAVSLGASECRVKPAELPETEALVKELFARWIPAT